MDIITGRAPPSHGPDLRSTLSEPRKRSLLVHCRYLPLKSLKSLVGVATKQWGFLGFRIVPGGSGKQSTAVYEDDGSTTAYLDGTSHVRQLRHLGFFLFSSFFLFRAGAGGFLAFLSSTPPRTRRVLPLCLVAMLIGCWLVFGIQCCGQFGNFGLQVWTTCNVTAIPGSTSGSTWVTIASTGGYPAFPATRSYQIRLPNAAPPSKVTVDGAEVAYSRFGTSSFGNLSFIVATSNWVCVGIRRRRVLLSPVCA